MNDPTPGAVASTDQVGLVKRLSNHYGHHYTTTRNGIGTGEHHDFTRHPLVGEAIAEIERLRAALLVNHKWHQDTDDYGGYDESELCAINTAALGPNDRFTGRP